MARVIQARASVEPEDTVLVETEAAILVDCRGRGRRAAREGRALRLGRRVQRGSRFRRELAAVVGRPLAAFGVAVLAGRGFEHKLVQVAVRSLLFV